MKGRFIKHGLIMKCKFIREAVLWGVGFVKVVLWGSISFMQMSLLKKWLYKFDWDIRKVGKY